MNFALNFLSHVRYVLFFQYYFLIILEYFRLSLFHNETYQNLQNLQYLTDILVIHPTGQNILTNYLLY